MSAIDKYIDELRRSGDTAVILLSESEPRLRGKTGERTLEGKISHKEVTALVEEIIPPECFADLVMMEPVEFPFSHEAGEISIRVVPGPSIWRVLMDVRGDGLAPLPAGGSGDEESPSQTLTGLGAGAAAALAQRFGSVNPLDEALIDAVEASAGIDDDVPLSEALIADQGDLLDDDVPLSEALLADQGDLLDDDDGDIDLASFLPSTDEGPLSDDDENGASATSVDGTSASAPPPHADPDIGAADGGDPGFGGPLAPTAARPVEPLEIDFTEGDLPLLAIEALDTLMDAAWSLGATGLLLRDDCVPLMVRGKEVSELPFAKPEQGRLVHDIVDMVASPSQAEQLEIMGQCRFVYLTGSATRVRCTLVQDSGALAASVRRIGDEHLPDNSAQWMSETVRDVLPPHGLVLVCGAPGQGKTTTASALAACAHEQSPQTVVVGDPLERRLAGGGAGLLQRRIPDDVPNCAQALQDVHLLEASLVLVDVPRPDMVALAMLSLAAQGRVVIATWPAPDCLEAIGGLMDALPPELAPTERARRARGLAGVIAVQLEPAASGGVLPVFEVLRTNAALLGAVAESRLDALRGTEIRQITFESSRALLMDRGLLKPGS